MDRHDHRAIANRMDLFHQQEEGPGMVFWHPRGWALYRVVEDYIRRLMRRGGFEEIRTPQVLARALWEASGHWEKFADNMFTTSDGERQHALKPMSCPAHVQVFAKRLRSFRDLPLRYAEFGGCHRNEPSGALHGLMRTRAFHQDDAHIFCSEAQVTGEVARFCRLLMQAYADFGFADLRVAFSTRPARRAGAEAEWDRAEAMLAQAAREAGLVFEIDPGEGAFYGPKLDFHLRDAHGREWQCGTVQLDLVLPERLGARYVDAEGARARPVMIHHAVLGSLERFIGILLEHHRGSLPLWLAPDQVVVAPITPAEACHARRLADRLAEAGLRARADLRSETLSRRIVDAHEDGVPVVLAIGQREVREGTVTLRRRDGTQVVERLDAAIVALQEEARPPSDRERAVTPVSAALSPAVAKTRNPC